MLLDLRSSVMFLLRFWHLSRVFERQVSSTRLNVCLAQGHEGSRAIVWSNWLSEKELVRKGCLLVKRV